MIKTFLSLFGFGSVDDANEDAGADSRRFHRFDSQGTAKVVINGAAFELRDWSQGGVFVNQDLPLVPVGVGDKLEMILEFTLESGVVRIAQAAEVVRSARRGFAVRFESIDRDARRQLDRVIDTFHTQSFTQSQLVA